jgi:hypothetical protein
MAPGPEDVVLMRRHLGLSVDSRLAAAARSWRSTTSSQALSCWMVLAKAARCAMHTPQTFLQAARVVVMVWRRRRRRGDTVVVAVVVAVTRWTYKTTYRRSSQWISFITCRRVVSVGRTS